MGLVESLQLSDVSNPKSGKFIIKGKTHTLEEIVSMYNIIASKVQYFEAKAQNYLSDRDKFHEEVKKLQHELDQLKTVLNLKIDAEEEPSVSSKDKNVDEGKLSVTQFNQRLAVSAEATKTESVEFPRINKSVELKNMIKQALLSNEFLEHLDKSQILAMIDYMIPMEYKSGDYVINQGEYGNGFYVIEEGLLEVYKNGEKLPLKPLSCGKLFGELAILYNCTRTASVRAVTDSKLFFIKREVYQYVMKQNATYVRQENLKFLESVPVLSKIDKLLLKKVADAIDEVYYSDGEYIIREGEKGDSFYIIKSGCVDVLKNNENNIEEKLNSLTAGQCFGEKALLKDETRSATVKATTSVTCLTVERELFAKIAGNISSDIGKDYIDNKEKHKVKKMKSKVGGNLTDYSLDEFTSLVTLGQGAFGKVDLIQNIKNNERFALKKMDKAHIVKTKQQEHTNSEKDFLLKSNSPFIIKLYQTFKDVNNVYLLLDACMGGDLFTVLHGVERFDPKSARFYVGCAIEAFDYIHSHGYVYRDLKPENMLLDSNGYVKLVDFGFTKKINEGEKTFTFCGTPEYVAPEVILSKGHDKTADYWSLGILVYELINGSPPFTSNDSMVTYRMILKGIDSITFSKKIPKYPANLIKSLCKENPAERIGNHKEGIDAIRKHKWFEGFHWSGLQKCTLSAPLVPKEPKIKQHKEPKPIQVTPVTNSTESDWDFYF